MSAQVTITQLPAAGAITGTESVPIVQNGQTVRTTTGAIAASPNQTQTFITVNQEPTLPNSRYLGATNGLTLSASSPQGVLNITTTGALSSLVSSGTGLQVKTDSTTLTGRTIAAGTAGLSVANGNGISGNPTVSLTGQVLGLANASGNGLLTLNNGNFTISEIVGTANSITVTNGTGLSGNPTIAIASNPTLPGTAGVALPSGTTAQRAAASNGTLRYNSDTGLLEAYLSGVWTSLSAGSGVTSVATGTGLNGGPITSTGTISLANTAVTAGSYTSANITVNAQGQITAASSNTAGGATLTISTGLSGTSYNGSAPVTIAISNTGVSAASYGSATQVGTFTVNAQGQLTAASNTTVTPAVGSITGLGTGVATALAVNTGNAGAFVVNGGDLGTPSGGVVTNLSGTASININGTVGATTPTTGAFTTVSASGVITSTVATGTAPFTVASTTAVTNLSIGGNAATATSATTATTATNATNVALTAGSGATNYITFGSAATGNTAINTNTGLTFNATTGSITGGISGGTF